ncbi:DUF4329 domain-containing protein [Nioella nitratireducens]|uniref:DUF4329 domain-containing protein n=1 Tax=Nioella nitratireducens TaxID=1287720 RepID=UPI0008FD8988|nr:DUF4329 domain-containing protein [Nioella nitratireducens]
MRVFPALFALLTMAVPATAQSVEETELVHALFRSMNPQSIAHNREVCGYVVRSPAGELGISKVSWGSPAACATIPVEPGFTIVSSWHTHAAWAQGYDGEVPSTIDVEGDMQMGVNGWVATPGGRLWFIDGQSGFMYQVCGRECLPTDPGFYPEEHGPVEKRYTLAELRRRFVGR